MENKIEYMKLFVEYEHDNAPAVFFYEVDLGNNRFLIREIVVYADRRVTLDNNPDRDVIEIVPIPTIDELNSRIWGDGFFATAISKEEFETIWESGIYNGDLSAT